jgi:hypothetical protein
VTLPWRQEQKAIITQCHLEIEEQLKGSNGRELIYNVIGGVTESGEFLYTPDGPRCVAGEKVLVFLWDSGDGYYPSRSRWGHIRLAEANGAPVSTGAAVLNFVREEVVR